MGSRRTSACSGCKYVQLLRKYAFLLILSELAWGCRSLSPDGKALLHLKSTLVDKYNMLSSWSAADDLPCTWQGVTCHASSGSVTSLDLSYFNLSGTLPPSGNPFPSSLYSINLCCNSLSGSLSPSLFSNLSLLSFLDLSHNSFTGFFPNSAFPPSLLTLSAFSNNFTGPLPVNLSLLPSLQHLDLGGSFFEGIIPPQYGLFPLLTYLSLSGNSLTGHIPPQLGNLSHLTHLVLGYNKFEHSRIPSELGFLLNLQYLDLCCTSLSGTIPPQLGSLTSLVTLFLYRNALVGGIPPELGNMSSLMSLDVSLNNLSGSIPPQLGNLQNLTLLSMMFNSLSGTLPAELGNMQNLLTLLVWNNSLSGSLPLELGRNSPLQWVDVSSNMFSGPIPPDLCFHGNLTKLIMFSNTFTGNIPESLAKCQSLLRVRMHDNQLAGSIPDGFGSLIKLTRLELQRNRLNGTIPSDMSFSAMLNYLDVSHNSLEGGLAPDLWSLPHIESFYATGNKLTGTIPSEFGECLFLTILDLSQNSFAGDIPASLSNCHKLVTIQLQQNVLSGRIPSKLAYLPVLEVLDLSNNNLTGIIPLDFKTTNTLETFNVSYNNLSGVLPSEGIFKTASPSSFIGNPGLMCGGVLGPCSSDGNAIGFPSGLRKRVTWSLAWLLGCVLLIFTMVFLFIGWRYVVMRYGLHTCHNDIEENSDEWPWRLTAFQRLSFTCNDVLEALKDENVVGRGGTGVVYKAEMPGGDIVAVKKLSGTQKEAIFCKDNAFRREIDLLGSIRHRNIVRLLGYCSNNANTLLIYEYMTNGSLGDALHCEQKSNVLADWVTRYNIAVGIAQGLCYLHHDCFPQVIHRDVKSNNILLDAHMEARVADFGVAKLIETNDSMSMIAGSYGYIAPEYAYTLKVNEKTDIYSFGVVLLELLTGRRPVECEFGDAMNIVEWVRVKMAGMLRGTLMGGSASTEDDDHQFAAMVSEAKRSRYLDVDPAAHLRLDCNVCRGASTKGATQKAPHMHVNALCSRWDSSGGRFMNNVAAADHNHHAAATTAGGTSNQSLHHQQCTMQYWRGANSREGSTAPEHAAAVPAGEGLGIALLDCNAGASCWWVQEEMLLVLRIALLCTSRFPRDRPSMRDVVTMLAEAKPRRKLTSSSPITSTTTSSCQEDETSPLRSP